MECRSLMDYERQSVPCRERVHIVSPMRDFSIRNFHDRAEAILVGRARCENCPMDLIFDDDCSSAIRLVDDQLICGFEFDVVAIAFELSHQGGAPLNDARPTWEFI